MRLSRGWAGVVSLALIVAVVLAGCGSGGSGPPTGAAKLLPADALAYVNVSLDSGRPAVRQALKLARRFPDYALGLAALRARLQILVGGPASGRAESLKPWLGNEAAIALLSTPTARTSPLVVLDVRDRGGAQAFLTRSGARPTSSYEGTLLLRTASGSEAAFVSHFLVLGEDAGIRAAVDVALGRTPSLAGSTIYQRAAAGEPDSRVLDAYASASGVRVLAARSGLPGALIGLLYQPALSGVSLALWPVQNGAGVRIHSALDSSLLRVSEDPGGVAFKPSLQSAIPAGSMLMLDVSGLARVAPRVLAAGAAGGIGGQVAPLLRRLGQALASEGVNVGSLLALFGGETAVAVTSGTGKPALLIVARTANEQQVRTQLAALEIPLEQLFPPATAGPGQAPAFNDRHVGGVTIHQLSLAPGLELDYALDNGLLFVSTGVGAITAAVARARSLPGDADYRAVLPAVPDQVTALLFLDFSQLLHLGEQTGLTQSARFSALRGDLQRIRAVGLESTRGEAESTVELLLKFL